MLARLDKLRTTLSASRRGWRRSRATIARALVNIESREAALLGLDVPHKMILSVLDAPDDRDEITMRTLQERCRLTSLTTLKIQCLLPGQAKLVIQPFHQDPAKP